MNWIEYAERKPSPEPKRKILLYFQEGGGGGGAFITDTFDAQLTHSATHWAEIEGPTNMKAEDPSEEWSRQLIGDREYKAMLKKESPPPTDPFEELSKAIPQYTTEWMPKSLWGPIKWRELHARGFLDLDMSAEHDWFKSFIPSVPCPKCQKHFEQFISVVPPDFSSRLAWFHWTVHAHNFVNQSTSKRIITLDEAYKLHHFLKDEEAP